MTDDVAALSASLAQLLTADGGGEPVPVRGLVQLSGGASKESWTFEAHRGGQWQRLILRRDQPGAVPMSRAIEERPLLAAVRSAGVPVPLVLLGGIAEEWQDASFLIMEHIEGETLARRILRDQRYVAARTVLLADAAAALAGIHSIDTAALDFMGDARSTPRLLDDLEALLDDSPDRHPAFEYGLRWLRRNQPPLVAPAVVHGDYRLGNLIVGEEGLRSVIDWELSYLGDPIRDLGYFCVRSWRFGNDALPAGGLGSRRQLCAAYEAAGGNRVDPDTLHYWEVYGNAVWGVQTGFLAKQFLDGLPSVELAAIGRRAVEMEYDLLHLLNPAAVRARARAEA